jgi:predicted alpha/beta hydrolase
VSTALTLTTRDGTALAADYVAASGTVRGSVLLAGAMGVPRGFYAPFAQYLAAHGLATLTLDYRGLGGSAPAVLRGFKGGITDWVDQDLPAAMDALEQRAPGVPLLWIGHSVGGQLMGFMDTRRLHAALFVAAQSGYWRRWHTARWRAFMWGISHVLMPAFAGTLGYVPARFFGSPLPAEVARQWASWIRDPEYLGRLARTRDWADFRRYDKPLRLVTVSDDDYAPWQPGEGLLALYAAARKEHLGVTPSEVGAQAIGHFAMFRPKFRDTLWQGWKDWLLAQASTAA